MKIDQSKLNKQKECLRAWKANGYTGTIEGATGFGKTYMAILGIKEMLYRKGSDVITGVIVPTDYLRNKWREEVRTHKVPNVEVDTINGWMTRNDYDKDMWILDEIHGYTGGEVWSTIFQKIKYDRLLGLTAKERNKEEDKALLEEYAPIVARVPMKECLANGWVSPFTVYNLGLELSAEDRLYYDKLHKKFIKYFSTFDFNLGLMFGCLKDEETREKVADDMRWSKKQVMIHAAQANRVMQKRKQWLYTHDLIFDKSVEIINAFPDKRIITFSEVTSFANRLEDAIPNSVAYHTSLRTKVVHNFDKETKKWEEQIAVGVKNEDDKTVYKTSDGNTYKWKEIKKEFPDKNLTRVSGSRQRDRNLEMFQNGEVDIIHSATALNEGVDIPNIDMSVKNSFNSTIKDSIQRTGRTARIDDENENKRAIEVNLYIKDTQSLRWLEKSQKETPNVKWIESVQEIV